MDDDTPNYKPGSSSGQDATDWISLEDCDEWNDIVPFNPNHSNWKQPSQPFQQETQHDIFPTNDSSVFSPQSKLPTGTLGHSFLENQLPGHPAEVESLSQENFQLQQQLQQQNLMSIQTFPSLPPRPLPVTLPNNTFLENQGHLQRSSVYQPPQTSHFLANQAAFIPPKKVLLTEANPYMAVASAAGQWQYPGYNQQQSHRQQLQPNPQFHSSADVNSQHPFIATERQISTSKEIYGGQPAESNPEQMLSLEEIRQVAKLLRRIRIMENLTQSDVASLLSERLKDKIELKWVNRLETFDNFFQNMCRIKRQLEPLMDFSQTSQSTTVSLPNKTEPNVSGLQTQAASDTTSGQFRDYLVCMQNPKPDLKQIAVRNSNFGTDGPLWNNSPGSSTDDVKAHMMPQERSCNSDKENNDPMEPHPKKKTTIGEMILFTKSFHAWRTVSPRLSQPDARSVLLNRYNINISVNMICEFERFSDTPEFICKVKPILEEWWKDIVSVYRRRPESPRPATF